jgi:hypothetical protein
MVHLEEIECCITVIFLLNEGAGANALHGASSAETAIDVKRVSLMVELIIYL